MKSTHLLNSPGPWPELDYESWSSTLKTVHMWTQIVGKIRLTAMPWQNHSWQTSLYITPKGLTTGSIPYNDGIFDIEFNFINHQLLIRSSFGKDQALPLEPMSVALFYKDVFRLLQNLGIAIEINAKPNEVAEATPFYLNEADHFYDAK